MKLQTLIAVSFWCASGASGQVTALTHATVIDGTGNAPQRDTTVVMENGRIRDMGPSSLVQVPSGAAVTELTGNIAVRRIRRNPRRIKKLQIHILDHESGKILASFGRAGHQIGSFIHARTMAVDSKGNIYVAETDWGRRIQRFKPVASK